MKKNVIFGSSTAGFEFFKTNRQLEIHYFSDNDPKKWGKRYFGVEVIPPDKLLPEKHHVFIQSIFYKQIADQLRLVGFDSSNFSAGQEKEHFFFSNLEEIKKVLQLAKSMGINYCILRGVQPILTDGTVNDVDLLIDDKDINKFLSICEQSRTTDGLKIDIYGLNGTVGYRYQNMPYFPLSIGRKFLAKKEVKDGIFVPNAHFEALSNIYHTVFYKTSASASIINKLINNHDLLRDYKHKNRILTIADMVCLLKDNDFFPEFDIYRKTVVDDTTRNFLLKSDPKYIKYKRNAELLKLNHAQNRFIMVFLRKRSKSYELRALVEKAIKSVNLKADLVFRKTLSFSEQTIAMLEIRGGNWVDDYGEEINGPPVELLIFKNRKPEQLLKHKAKYFPFEIIDDTYFIKEMLRDNLIEIHDKSANLNIFHSTDDDIEMLYYANILNIDFKPDRINGIHLRNSDKSKDEKHEI